MSRLIDADAFWKHFEEGKAKLLLIKSMLPQEMIDATLKIYAEIKEMIDSMPTIKSEPPWIPCSERLPEEDYWLGGSGKQFSDEVLVSVSNSADEDVYVYVSQTLDGKWNLELPEYYEVIAWMPLPEPYQPEEESE